MNKITTFDELKQQAQRSIDTDTEAAGRVQVKVAMSTCGIASGAQDTLEYFANELQRQKIAASVIQTGCMGYCYAEPTVEITLPGEDPVVFGFVNSAKAQEIIDVYIARHQLVDGIIPPGYRLVD